MDEAWIVAARRSDGVAPKVAKATWLADDGREHYKLFARIEDAQGEANELNRILGYSQYQPYRVLVEVQP